VGEHLYLSKPLGTSLALRAANEHQLGQISAEEAFSILTTSNGSASLAAVSADVHACSDVSGFGLLGHACQLLPDGLGAVISYSSVPLVDGVESVPNAFFQAPWLHSNLEYAQSLREIRTNFSFRDLGVLLDPQTNGGLLVAAYPTQSEPLLNAGYKHIGEVVAGSMITIAS
jgi:selenide,water dikinase